MKIDSLTASVTGVGTTTGVFIYGSSNAVIRDSSVTGSSSSITRFSTAQAAAFNTVFNGVPLGMNGHCFNAVTIGLVAYSCP